MSWVAIAQKLLLVISRKRKFSTMEIDELSQLKNAINKIVNKHYNNQNKHLEGN